MSKWLKSTTLKSWQTALGSRIIKIPTFKESFLELTDDDYLALEKLPVVKSLIRNGDILVSNMEPAEVSRSADKLLDSNAKLRLQLAKLQEENAKLKETSHSDLADTNDELQKELDKTKKALEKAKAEVEATKKEALEELGKMQAQLNEANKG